MYADNKTSKTAMELLVEVLNVVEKIGIDNTVTLLKTAGEKIYENKSQEIDYILEIICIRYSTTKHSILMGTGNNENKSHATDVFFYMLKTYLGMTNKAIGDMCSLHDSSVSKGASRIRNLDFNNKVDHPKLVIIREIEQQVKDYIRSKMNQ